MVGVGVGSWELPLRTIMFKYSFFCLIFVVQLFCLTIPVWAQDNTQVVNSDRPDRTQGPAVVPPGTVQIETGLQYQKDKSANPPTKEFLYPETLIRVGIVPWAEIRFNAEYKQVSHKATSEHAVMREKGFNNVQVGTKLKFYEGKGAIPAIGFQGNITLPWGSNSFRPARVSPEGALVFSNKITDKLDVQYNVGYGRLPGEDTYQGKAYYAIGTNLKLIDNLQCYGEFFAQKAKALPVENTVDVGLMVQTLPNLLLDVAMGMGVSKAASGYFVGTGLTWRLPR